MAYRPQASFSTGELDPALWERTALQKYDAGLATARNVFIGKTGRVISRASRENLFKTKVDGERCVLYSPSGSGYVMEWGNQYVRVYSVSKELTFADVGALCDEHTHALTEADLPNISFDYSQGVVYVFCPGKETLKFIPSNGGGGFLTPVFSIPPAPSFLSDAASGSGYLVDYKITYVIGGEESLGVQLTYLGYGIPQAAGEINKLNMILTVIGNASLVTEMRVYRRPRNAGAFGYIGSSSAFFVSGGNLGASFSDIGQAADYTHGLPTLADTVTGRGLSGPEAFLSGVGIIYQDRLILNVNDYPESIEASRTGLKNNFYQDHPLSDDSSLTFKAGTSGVAKILRFLDSDGLIVFTSIGVFLNNGVLSVTNLSLAKKGNWVIDKNIPPLGVPGGALFVDVSTGGIRALRWSTELASYAADEISVFSNHLFEKRTVKSWAFQEGDAPLLWVVFSDGEYASLNYEREQEMRAWTRHDSFANMECVVATGVNGQMCFLVEKDDVRYVELTVPRFIKNSDYVSNPEADKGLSAQSMDSAVSFQNILNDNLVGADVMRITPVVDGVWDGQLQVNCGTSGLFLAPGPGTTGNMLKFFNPDDGSEVDLKVIARHNNNEIIVETSSTFPSEFAESNPRLYLTSKTFSGLDHLEGEFPAVVGDGYVICSPNNDDQNYELAQVIGGVLTLTTDINPAIVHIGRAFVSDIETLEPATVEQRPIFIESKTDNKVYIKTYRSSGIYLGNKFPPNDKVKWEGDSNQDMVDIESISIDYEQETQILANRYQAPTTKRHEVILPGDWNSSARVCLRNVDPKAFEILSIIPDLQDLQRSDR